MDRQENVFSKMGWKRLHCGFHIKRFVAKGCKNVVFFQGKLAQTNILLNFHLYTLTRYYINIYTYTYNFYLCQYNLTGAFFSVYYWAIITSFQVSSYKFSFKLSLWQTFPQWNYPDVGLVANITVLPFIHSFVHPLSIPV